MAREGEREQESKRPRRSYSDSLAGLWQRACSPWCGPGIAWVGVGSGSGGCRAWPCEAPRSCGIAASPSTPLARWTRGWCTRPPRPRHPSPPPPSARWRPGSCRTAAGRSSGPGRSSGCRPGSAGTTRGATRDAQRGPAWSPQRRPRPGHPSLASRPRPASPGHPYAASRPPQRQPGPPGPATLRSGPALCDAVPPPPPPRPHGDALPARWRRPCMRKPLASSLNRHWPRVARKARCG